MGISYHVLFIFVHMFLFVFHQRFTFKIFSSVPCIYKMTCTKYFHFLYILYLKREIKIMQIIPCNNGDTFKHKKSCILFV